MVESGIEIGVLAVKQIELSVFGVQKGLQREICSSIASYSLVGNLVVATPGKVDLLEASERERERS